MYLCGDEHQVYLHECGGGGGEYTLSKIAETSATITYALMEGDTQSGVSIVVPKDSNLVHATGEEEIGGEKTFTDDVFLDYGGDHVRIGVDENDRLSAYSWGDRTVKQGVFAYKSEIEGGSVNDVQINGTSIVDDDGVADIPIASHDILGLVKTDNSSGGYSTGLLNVNGLLYVNTATNGQITNRSIRKQIDASNIDYAVKAAMGDGIGPAWTESEKANARERIGVERMLDRIEAQAVYTALMTDTLIEEGE